MNDMNKLGHVSGKQNEQIRRYSFSSDVSLTGSTRAEWERSHAMKRM